MSQLVTVCERIVQDHQCEKYDGVTIDATTANAIVVVAASLSPENRAKIDEIVERRGIVRFVEFCWSVVK